MENITELLQPYISLSEFIQILVSCISLAIALGSLYQSKKTIPLTENSILSANRPYIMIYIETLDTVYFERYIVICVLQDLSTQYCKEKVHTFAPEIFL